MTYAEQIQNSVVQNMSEGVIAISFNGTVSYCNTMATVILGTEASSLTGSTFAELILEHPENDEFYQAVIDAVYSEKQPYTAYVTYHTGSVLKHLRLTTSYFRTQDGRPAGITIVVSDLSELMELRDALKAMEKIKLLNRKLNDRNKLLSKTFGQFLSDEIVSELLNAPGGVTPGGHKRFVTIMMSDLRGFTAMSEQMDPEDLIAMLNHYLEAMTDIIQRRGGTIIEFIGDGILALFGAPKSSPNHAADAVAAALEMQESMQEVNAWNAGRDYPMLEMGIGIDSGEVIVGNIGSQKRMKYGVVGSHVNLCGRIESYTTGGQILIPSNVKDQIESGLEIDKKMTVFPKGSDEEITLFHVVGIGEPYRIHLHVKHRAPKRLPSPVPVCFNRMEEKHTLEKPFYGGILSVAPSCAELETETDLKLFENLRIDVGGQLFAKVTEKNDNIYLLQYTSVPSGYREWVRLHS